MARKSIPRKDEPYSTSAYFEIVLESILYNTIVKRVLEKPEFWDYLEETFEPFMLEIWANSQLRPSMLLLAVHADNEALAEIESIPKGGKFQFLKDKLCVVDEGEEKAQDSTLGEETTSEAQDASMSGILGDDEAEEEDVKLDDGDWESWESDVSEREPEAEQRLSGEKRSMDEIEKRSESGQPSTETRRVGEWSRYDSETEHWYPDWTAGNEGTTRRAPTPPGELNRVWEWTQYESQAEREEADRATLL